MKLTITRPRPRPPRLPEQADAKPDPAIWVVLPTGSQDKDTDTE